MGKKMRERDEGMKGDEEVEGKKEEEIGRVKRGRGKGIRCRSAIGHRCRLEDDVTR